MTPSVIVSLILGILKTDALMLEASTAATLAGSASPVGAVSGSETGCEGSEMRD